MNAITFNDLTMMNKTSVKDLTMVNTIIVKGNHAKNNHYQGNDLTMISITIDND